jgi:hypothetical protein
MIFASRDLTLRMDNGEQTIAIRLFAPECAEGDWACRYEIDWPHQKRRFKAHGVDAVQALMLALHMVAADLYTSPYHEAGGLFWEKPGAGYGFPLPTVLKYLAVGDDAKEV